MIDTQTDLKIFLAGKKKTQLFHYQHITSHHAIYLFLTAISLSNCFAYQFTYFNTNENKTLLEKEKKNHVINYNAKENLS